jgi:anaphase-promoting complex subunit 2
VHEQVNIYGSRELFVNEYRMMLADKLLQNQTYNTDQDVQTLELLKLRFGEDSLQQCETMVRDLDESKRINHHIHKSELERKDGQAPLVAEATIVSSQFWPPLQSEDFALHASVAAQIERYKDAFNAFKTRQLTFHNSLGSVQVRKIRSNSVSKVCFS